MSPEEIKKIILAQQNHFSGCQECQRALCAAGACFQSRVLDMERGKVDEAFRNLGSYSLEVWKDPNKYLDELRLARSGESIEIG